MGESDSRRGSRIPGADPRTEVDEELAFHREELVRLYEARGMGPEEARAAAAARLGDVGAVRAECTELLESERRRRRLRERLGFSWLDFKLGLRMLVRYPGLTVVGGLAIAFGIWLGAKRQVKSPKVYLSDTGLFTHAPRHRNAYRSRRAPQGGSFLGGLRHQ